MRDATLKVTFCTYDKPDSIGGPGAWLSRLIPDLNARGITVRCLALVHCGDTGPTVQQLQAQGIECSVTQCPDYLEDQVTWILTKLRDDPPDVFVPNLVLAGFFAARWLKAAGIPSIGVVHSDDDYYRGIVSDFVLGPPAWRISSVVCVSRELERQINGEHPVGVLVRTIPCGVPIPSATVARVGGKLRLAYVGRLVEEQKQISQVARAFCRATTELAGVDALIVGEGPDRDRVEAVLANECSGAAVHLSGRVDVDRIQDLLLGRDVIALLSDYEGLPIALMEAMACGCVPVVLKVRSGIPELVDNEETGLVVADRGAGFVQAIERLRDDPALWARLSAGARRKIVETYSESSSSHEWERLLYDIAAVNNQPMPIKIPARLRFADGHPALDIRKRSRPRDPRWIALYRRGRIEVGRLRRILFGKPDATS
jgi:glycosyltransferase involved in cell wall biosynthesis